MNAFDGPVVKARDAERAAVANAARENFVGVTKVVAILPNDLEHVAKVARLAGGDAERDEAFGNRCFSDGMLHERQNVSTVAPPAQVRIDFQMKRAKLRSENDRAKIP
jgi:hypothetical protein